jgi:hypothetical protein
LAVLASPQPIAALAPSAAIIGDDRRRRSTTGQHARATAAAQTLPVTSP